MSGSTLYRFYCLDQKAAFSSVTAALLEGVATGSRSMSRHFALRARVLRRCRRAGRLGVHSRHPAAASAYFRRLIMDADPDDKVPEDSKGQPRYSVHSAATQGEAAKIESHLRTLPNMHTDNLRARALADEACGRRNTSPSLPHLLRNRVAPITSSGCTTRGCRRAGRGGGHQEPTSRTSFEFHHPSRRRTRLHQMGWLQTSCRPSPKG